MIPHQGIGSPLFSLFLIKLFGGAQGIRDEEEAYLHYIFCKVKNRIQWKKQVIQSDQDVHVCGIFLDGTRTPFCMTPSFILGYGLSFFFAFFSFFFMLLGMIFFAQPISFGMMNMESHVKGTECFCVDGRHNFQCRSQRMGNWVGESRQNNNDVPRS